MAAISCLELSSGFLLNYSSGVNSSSSGVSNSSSGVNNSDFLNSYLFYNCGISVLSSLVRGTASGEHSSTERNGEEIN